MLERKLEQQLAVMARELGERQFCNEIVRHLIAFVRPEEVLPASLSRYMPLVRDGIKFFLSAISSSRLCLAIRSQARLPTSSSQGERLLDLARYFPTLQKLGQIIARNPGLDPEMKSWLVQLESSESQIDLAKLSTNITSQLSGMVQENQISLVSGILAEASVAVVLPYLYKEGASCKISEGVLKVLKPGIEKLLREELAILKKTAGYLEDNRSNYGLQDLMIADLFAEVGDDLANEIDLVCEQENLVEAARVYGNIKGVKIPALYGLCTPAITSMERIEGSRITDVDLPRKMRHNLARQAFEALICIPLFSPEETALFHGDPHAGNVLAVINETNDCEVALIDWTLAGRLSRIERCRMMEMLVGIITEDISMICAAIIQMTSGNVPGMDLSELNRNVAEILMSLEEASTDPLKKTFALLEEMTLAGLVFPSQLLLFRKAFYTLEGVLLDVSPGFSMGEAMEDYLGRILLEEFPQRFGSFLLHIPDKAAYYRSLLSSGDLGKIALFQALSSWRRTSSMSSNFIEAQMRITTDFMAYLWNGGLFSSNVY